MQISVTDLKLGLNNKRFIFSPSVLPERNINFLSNKIECDISSQKMSGGNFNIHGKLFLKVGYDCVRCLENKFIDHQLPFDFDVISSRKRYNNISNRFDHIQLDKNEVYIDLSDVFADIIALAKPMKPLCKSKCKGICIICGNNKNEIKCSCTVNLKQNVWDDLKKLNIK